MLYAFSYIQLIIIVSHNTLNRLSQTPGVSVLMISILKTMLMEYDQSFLCRISGTVQIPVMPGIPALYRHILAISNYDIEIISINLIKALLFKHSQPPY